MEYYPETEAAPQPPAPRPTWTVRLWGFGIIVLSVVLLGALITYRAEEVSWAFLHPTAAPAQPCTNALGIVGLYVAGLFYWLLGAGALYGFFLLILMGFGMLLHPEARRGTQALALLCLLLCACTGLAVQSDVLIHWAQARGLNTPGGQLGYLDGICVLVPLLGREAALCALLAAHWFALLYFSRLTLRSFCLGVKEDALRFVAWQAERRRLRDERRAAAREAWQQRVAEEQAAAALSPTPAPTEQAPLPPRRRSGLFGRMIPKTEQSVPEPQPTVQAEMRDLFEDEEEPLPLEEQLADARRRDAERERFQTPAQARRSRYAPAVNRSNRSNLLDLMQPVEQAIALSNAAGPDELPPIIDNPPVPQSRRRVAPEPAPRRAAEIPPPRETPPAPKAAPRVRAAAKPAAVATKDERPQQSDYPLPPYELLKYEPATAEMDEQSRAEMAETQACVIETLDTFRIAVTPGDITRGPSVTRYEFYPPRGMRVNRIEALQKDLMLATKARSINILAPIPGKDTVGIELENSVKSPVYLRELLQSDNFKNPKLAIPVALGKDVYGNAIIGDLAAMPHTLVAGTTGSGKSVCINSMILSMLYKFRPDELRLILVDPKVVEMQPYRTLPHLACPVVTNPARVIGALRWAVNEMERRYRMFSMVGVRNFKDFNARNPLDDPRPEPPPAHEELYTDDRMASSIMRDIEDSNDGRDIPDEDEEMQQGELDLDRPDELPDKIPYIVIIIDELADLMQVVKEDLEAYIARLTQKARAAGIHLVAATQTPRSDVVTGLIKANIPSRIAFRVASPLDSRIILDTKGAENLLGKGDSLFVPPDGLSKMTRVQGAFVSDAEIQKIINFCASHAEQKFEQGVTAEMNNSDSDSRGPADNERFAPKSMSGEDAELYERCVNLVITERKASTSLLQRRFSIGYGKAAKIMDQMEENGIIGPSQGTSRPREVLVEEA
ncbi:MAG: DNA translocase FtsK [Akkermansia sp.]|nr:DNA translocase FtsK [Akkermansia sp.]